MLIMFDMTSSPTKAPPRPVLTGILFGGILAVSTASIFIRMTQGEGVPSIVIAAARLTIASLILAPFALTRYRSELKGLTRREWTLGLLSGLFLAFHFASWITSLQYTTVSSSVVLVTTTPLWVALLSPLVLREKITPMIIIGMLLALAGGGIVAVSDSCTFVAGQLSCPPVGEFLRGSAFLGNFLAVFGAWMAAGYILIGRRLRAKMSLVPYIFVVYGMAAVVLIAVMFGMGKSPTGYPPLAYLWLVLLALVPQLLGHTSFNWALRYLPASFVSVTLLGEPIGSTILAVLFLQETPGWSKIGGAVLILVGIYLAAMGDKDD
jgi:drug/metabolite transporter (DMT)-like permease